MPRKKREMIPQYQTCSQPLNINEEFQIFSLWHISDLTNNILNVTINKLIQQALTLIYEQVSPTLPKTKQQITVIIESTMAVFIIFNL